MYIKKRKNIWICKNQITYKLYFILCILYVNMVLTVESYIMSEIILIDPGGLMFTVNQI